jgi:hypothetical protein
VAIRKTPKKAKEPLPLDFYECEGTILTNPPDFARFSVILDYSAKTAKSRLAFSSDICLTNGKLLPSTSFTLAGVARCPDLPSLVPSLTGTPVIIVLRLDCLIFSIIDRNS